MSKALASMLRKSRTSYSELWQERSRTGFATEPGGEVVAQHFGYWDAIIDAAENGETEALMGFAREAGRYQFHKGMALEDAIRRTVAATNTIEIALLNVGGDELTPSELISEVGDLRSMIVMAVVDGYREALAESEARPAERPGERLRAVLARDPNKRAPIALAPGAEIGPLYDQELRFYVVDTGKMRLYNLLPNGRTVTLSILSEGDVFFQWRTQDTSLSCICAEAMQRSTVLAIAEKELIELLGAQPSAAIDIITNFARRLTESQVLIEDLMANSVNLRLYRTLSELGREFGQNVGGNGSLLIKLPLTHQRLADIIGSNRVTVTRKLHELQRRGIVAARGAGSIEILDPAKLAGLVASSDQ
jgi:CRP-like cAMP-binding protein